MPSTPSIKTVIFLSLFVLTACGIAYGAWRVASVQNKPETEINNQVFESDDEPEQRVPLDESSENIVNDAPAGDAMTESDTEADTSAADTGYNFGACDEDAHTYCSGFYSADWQTYAIENGYTTASWKYGFIDCLGQHRDQTTAACDASLDQRKAINQATTEACRDDRAKLCPGTEPRPGKNSPEEVCLSEHYDELSDACREAFDVYQTAKPQR